MPVKNSNAKIFPRIDRRYMWIGLGIITLLINALFRANPYFTEVVFSRGIFLLIRWIWDYSFGLIPIPLLYIFTPLLFFYLIRRWRKGKPHRKTRPVINRLGSLFISILGLLGIALFLFYFLWGFNYNRFPVAQQLKLDPTELSDEEVEAEYEIATEEMIIAMRASNKAYKRALMGAGPVSETEPPVLYDSLRFANMYAKHDSLSKAFTQNANLEPLVRNLLKNQLE